MRFMTLDPGHFHAALVQKSMYPQVSREVDVYAPPGFDVEEHLKRIERFNTRIENPTSWKVNVHLGPKPSDRMITECPGNVVVIAGRNRNKIGYVLGAVEKDLHVLADKPWIIRFEDLQRLEQALSVAEARGLVAYDIMTERFEVTNALQRELVNDPAIFGSVIPGTSDEPAVYMRSVHHIIKTVDGTALRRPPWFFDIREQGEALADVGTHLVDLSLWTLFPDESLDPRTDVEVSAARRWPTVMTGEQFTRVTGEQAFPDQLRPWVEEEKLLFFANTAVEYALRRIHIKLDVLWDLDSEEHGDTHHAVYRGDRATIEVRQGAEQDWKPEVYVIPAGPTVEPAVRAAVQARVSALHDRWPGLEVEIADDRIHITIPDRHRLGHEAHFREVTDRFLGYLENPSTFPAWENAAMLTKYHITTRGSELSLQAG